MRIPARAMPVAVCTYLSVSGIPGAEAGVVFLASEWMLKNARHVRDRLARGSNYSMGRWVLRPAGNDSLASLFHIPPLLFSTSPAQQCTIRLGPMLWSCCLCYV